MGISLCGLARRFKACFVTPRQARPLTSIRKRLTLRSLRRREISLLRLLAISFRLTRMQMKNPVAPKGYKEQSLLLQLRVLGFGLLQDGDVGVGVFPEREEIFIGGERPDAGGIGIRALRSSRFQGVGTSHS
jgi:hypothetical protein